MKTNGSTYKAHLILRANRVVEIGENALAYTPIADGTGYIYVPEELVDTYKTAERWSTYADQIRAYVEVHES